MRSDLGRRIHETRKAQQIGLRELARRIDKSPAFVSQIESDNPPPPIAEETLRAIAKELRLNADELLVLSERTPSDVIPESVLEVELFRSVKELSEKAQREMLEKLLRQRRRGYRRQ